MANKLYNPPANLTAQFTVARYAKPLGLGKSIPKNASYNTKHPGSAHVTARKHAAAKRGATVVPHTQSPAISKRITLNNQQAPVRNAARVADSAATGAAGSRRRLAPHVQLLNSALYRHLG